MEKRITTLKEVLHQLVPADFSLCRDEIDLQTSLAAYINELIIHDFERLVQLLYRIDVSEQKLKQLLREKKGTDAGILIAQLIIQRQWEKIESRRNTQKGEEGRPEDREW